MYTIFFIKPLTSFLRVNGLKKKGEYENVRLISGRVKFSCRNMKTSCRTPFSQNSDNYHFVNLLCAYQEINNIPKFAFLPGEYRDAKGYILYPGQKRTQLWNATNEMLILAI